jgi:MscS family membrane protein
LNRNCDIYVQNVRGNERRVGQGRLDRGAQHRHLARDDVQISIPNSIMANTRITNESAPEPRYRTRIKVGVAYGSNFDQVEETLLEVAKANNKISAFAEPLVRFKAFGDSTIGFELLCWARRPEDRGIAIHQLGKKIY